MLTWLRIVAAYLALTILLVVVGLWIRSHRVGGTLLKVRGETTTVRVLNRLSEVIVISQPKFDPFAPSNPFLKWPQGPLWNFSDYVSDTTPRTLGFLRSSSPAIGRGTIRVLIVPYWFIGLISTVIAFVSWPAPRFRMSIREMFGITTMAAVVLAVSLKL